jgi:hypothetical protein
MTDKEHFEQIWRNFSQQDGYDLTRLSDEDLIVCARNFNKSGIHSMSSSERTWLFLTEINNRTAKRIAESGEASSRSGEAIAKQGLSLSEQGVSLSRRGLIIAYIAVGVGLVQVAIALYQAFHLAP